MDYLDPDKKRQHKIRLLFGYILFAIAIGLATLLLVYMANGFYIDRETGQVIQNGLVYIDSRPGEADIYLNGQKQRGATDARLVVPSGVYGIELKRDGYRDWSRSLNLEGGSLRRLTYARLIPSELTSTIGSALRNNPTSVSQSIDKKWLVLNYSDDPLQMDVIDTEQIIVVPQSIIVPDSVVTSKTSGVLEVVEWADDNKTFIAKYTIGATVNYILVDRENPGLAQNLNTLFGNTKYEIGFQDRKKDNFYIYSPDTKSLLVASIANGIDPAPIVTKVISYKTFGRDWVLYITDSGEEGIVEARFKRGNKDFVIKKLKKADKYLLQLAKLGTSPIMGISSPPENRAIVFNDPEKYLNENPNVSIPIATTVLRVENPIDLRISADSSVILAYGSGKFASHEFEADRSYNFTVDVPVDPSQEIRWLDGQHFLFSSAGVQFMMDFDGSNMYELVKSMSKLGSFYRSNIEAMYSFNPAVPAIGENPEIPANISITSLLTAADR